MVLGKKYHENPQGEVQQRTTNDAESKKRTKVTSVRDERSPALPQSLSVRPHNGTH